MVKGVNGWVIDHSFKSLVSEKWAINMKTELFKCLKG